MVMDTRIQALVQRLYEEFNAIRAEEVRVWWSVAPTPDYTDVPNPVEGTTFIYQNTGDVFYHDGEEWAYLGDIAPDQAWANITGKPTTFPPSTHTHAISDTTGLQTALDAKEPALPTTPSNPTTKFLRGDRVWAEPPAGGEGGGSGGGSTLLDVVSQTTSDEYSASSFWDEVDATNLVTTFTAPASGEVVVRLSAYLVVNNNSSNDMEVSWGLRENTTIIAEASALFQDANTGRTAGAVAVPFHITGLTPGNSYTYKWAWRQSGSGQVKMRSFVISNDGPSDAIIEVFEVGDGSGSGGAVDSVNGQTGVVELTQDDVPDGGTYKQYSSTEKTKLAGIATGATANDADANLKNRANHTGTQAQSTITNLTTDLAGKAASVHTHTASQVTDLAEAVQDIVGALIVAGTNVTVSYDDGAGTFTINSSEVIGPETLDAASLPFYVYGSSHSLLTMASFAGDHYSVRVAEEINAGTVTSYGQGGRRTFEAVCGAINGQAFPGFSTPVAAAKWPTDNSRKGLVILDVFFNDIGHYADTGAVPVALPGDGRYVDGFRSALRTFLALASSGGYVHQSTFVSPTDTWNAVGGPYREGTAYYTSTVGRRLTQNVTPPQTGPLAGRVYLLTYKVAASSGVLAPFTVSVDGGAAVTHTLTPWESFVGHGGTAVIIPHVVPLDLPVDGAAHTITVTHAGAGGDYLYHNGTIIPSDRPNPIALMEALVPVVGPAWTAPQIATWKANSVPVHAAAKQVAAEFPNAMWVPNNITPNGIYTGDGVHINDRGQGQRAAALQEVLELNLKAQFKARALEATPDSEFDIL